MNRIYQIIFTEQWCSQFFKVSKKCLRVAHHIEEPTHTRPRRTLCLSASKLTPHVWVLSTQGPTREVSSPRHQQACVHVSLISLPILGELCAVCTWDGAGWREGHESGSKHIRRMHARVWAWAHKPTKQNRKGVCTGVSVCRPPHANLFHPVLHSPTASFSFSSNCLSQSHFPFIRTPSHPSPPSTERRRTRRGPATPSKMRYPQRPLAQPF